MLYKFKPHKVQAYQIKTGNEEIPECSRLTKKGEDIFEFIYSERQYFVHTKDWLVFRSRNLQLVNDIDFNYTFQKVRVQLNKTQIEVLLKIKGNPTFSYECCNGFLSTLLKKKLIESTGAGSATLYRITRLGIEVLKDKGYTV